MITRETKLGRLHGWGIGLSIMSLILPVAAIFPLRVSTSPGTSPAGTGDYRLTVVALVLGLAFGVGASIANSAPAPSWLRGLSVVLASLGMLLGGYLLVTLIGTCGLGVIGGVCRP